MSNIKIYLLFMIILSTRIYASVFIPVPLSKAISIADVAVEVSFHHQQSYKDENGQIKTEVQLKILEKFGPEDYFITDQIKNNILTLILPGGTVDGQTMAIDGAPQFDRAKDSFLFLKKIKSQLYLSQFTLGKYNIENISGTTYYVSEIFPFHPEMGRVSKEHMLELLNKKWEKATPDLHSSTSREINHVVLKAKSYALNQDPKRSIASNEAAHIPAWVFIFMGAIALLLFLRRNHTH